MRTRTALLAVILLPPCGVLQAQDPAAPPPPAPAAEPVVSAAAGLLDLANDPKTANEPAGAAALGWLKFMAGGYRNAADCVGDGEAADAELALAATLEKAVPALAATLGGKKGKVKLNDAVEGPISRVDDQGFVVVVNKVEQTVPWAEVDPKQIAVQLQKGKPTAEADVAAIATLKLLGGDAADAKKQATKLPGELGKKLGELAEYHKQFGPELRAARSLDSILREPDAEKALERFKADWPMVKETKLARQFAPQLREQFILRGEKALAGPKALAAAIHGKVTVNPSRAAPAAGPGGVGMEIEYDFDKASEGSDFDPATLTPALLREIKGVNRGEVPIEPFVVDASRLQPTTSHGGVLPLEFAGDLEIELQGGIPERSTGGDVGLIAIGFTTADGKEYLTLKNFYALDVRSGNSSGPSAEKPIKKELLKPGMQILSVLRVGSGKIGFTMNTDGQSEEIPLLNYEPKAPLAPFLFTAKNAQWFVERFVIRGSATGESLARLARTVAEKEAKALFGE